jgi:hypothetical protein
MHGREVEGVRVLGSSFGVAPTHPFFFGSGDGKAHPPSLCTFTHAVYAVAKLVTFFNDWVIRRRFRAAELESEGKAGKSACKGSGSDQWMSGAELYASLLSLLTVIEHSSVFLELVGHTFFNSRWLFIVAFEATRCVHPCPTDRCIVPCS